MNDATLALVLVLIAAVFGGVFGWLLFRILFAPLYDRPETQTKITGRSVTHLHEEEQR